MADALMPHQVYYNENDPNAVRWLEYLIAGNLIPAGYVDSRSIADVQPEDLAGFTQLHFFAGIAGWARACDLAGWGSRPIWTASCPCQPFSVAGKRKGTDDARHLWPDLFRLVRACRPACLVGEQTTGTAGYDWLDRVRFDLESEDYACGAADIPACGVDAPHIRNRLYWLAHIGYQSGWGGPSDKGQQRRKKSTDIHATRNGLEHATSLGRRKGRPESEFRGGRPAAAEPDVSNGGLGNADSARLALGQSLGNNNATQCAASERADGRGDRSFWHDSEWLDCHDRKKRRAKRGTPLLDARIPGRVATWRGIGNSINPILAAEVLKAYLDVYPNG